MGLLSEGLGGVSGGVRLLELNQCQFLIPVASSAPIGDFLREHYHDFTVRAVAVLANTLPESDAHRGLLRDLSVQRIALFKKLGQFRRRISHLQQRPTAVALGAL